MRTHGLSRKALALVASGSMILVAACSGGSGETAGTTGDAGCQPAAAGQKVTLTFSSWVPGMQKTVDLWNKQNPDIQVDYKQVVGGPAGTYQAYANQIKAGNAGDLGMVEFDTLPSFRLQDGLLNIGNCPGIKEAAAKFVPWTIEQVSFGEPGAVYGIPQDIGPLALYYRKDLFDKNGIEVPKTWDQFYAAAQQVKAKGAFITNFPPDGTSYFAALAWQNGAKWFGNQDGKWSVSMTDGPTMQVAEYWQRMLTEKLVDTKPGLTNSQWKAMDTDQQWAMIGAAWTAKLIENGAPSTAGKWAVAPLPQWTEGAAKAGNWGGSNTVVFKGSKHPAEAAKFAAWAFGELPALELNNRNGGQFPATTEGQTKLPALTQPYSYFGDQVVWKVFQEAATQVDPKWQWGPTMTQTFADLGNGLSAAVNGQSTVPDALKQAQDKTITTMKSQGIEVGS
jgi:multiple sugar transport system substrate-binding protein